MVNPANAINATLYQKLNVVFLRDVAPIAGLGRLPIIYPSTGVAGFHLVCTTAAMGLFEA